MVERYKDRNRPNYTIIESNLGEAISTLQILREEASTGELTEEEFYVQLQHAYHHLNFAWHIRHITTRQYRKLTFALFNRWGRYPKIPCMKVQRNG